MSPDLEKNPDMLLRAATTKITELLFLKLNLCIIIWKFNTKSSENSVA